MIMKNTLSKLAALRRYLNLDYIFVAVGLASCDALIVYAAYVTIEVTCR